MAVPKRKTSKSRTRKKRNVHYKRKIVLAIKTKDKKGYKRPHRDEYIEV
ncbi:50S ribosomal protein L32 [candidate division WWE3 bacterium RBG_19FT_COMBO_34_6]|uniref:Large ribosomal subunit protein bL32 n=1 Tax=candidate division WWE3 bacterium RBG_19FT_COMBO_34_6 TaxID=1802612 RepID=A0A1F4ULC2_UNCKA|nr:MAG: 50S ribosomal protein L32 [candidate division WWE3 bacterium RBG_19FT_COMBO_34_6]